MKHTFQLLLIFVLIGVSNSCAKKSMESWIVKDLNGLQVYEDLDDRKIDFIKEQKCNNPNAYIPTGEDADPMYEHIVKVNVHFLNDSSGDKNFSGKAAIKNAHELINYANITLQQNEKMRLPAGNNTAVLDPLIKYQITPASDDPNDVGVYEHTDDQLYYFIKKGTKRNNYKKDVIKKYALKGDSIINIFVLSHHPDSLRSKTYSNTENGIAIGTALKLAGWFEEKKSAEDFSTLLNHEIAHIFGLRHTWNGHDSCDDTPKNANCWHSSGEPPCDGLTSNNMMDYNNSQKAITPCQIGVYHKNISNIRSKQRKLVIPQWCEYHEDFPTIIDRDTHWGGARDLLGDLIVKSGKQLTISCRVSFPIGAKLILEPGSELILDRARLHNACGDQWAGVECQVMGKDKPIVHKIGTVLLEDIGSVE